MSRELEFKIDAWTPDTIPQERLGEYLIELAKLYGEIGSVKFRRLRKGSTVVVSRVDGPARPKVERRLFQVRTGEAPKDAVDAFCVLDNMLAIDNSVGIIRGLDDGAVISFPGRDRPKPVEYGPVREEGFVEGEIIRIGGRDDSIHLAIQNGETVFSSIETNREMARQLGRLIFGPVVRFWGTGTWRRDSKDGWRLDRFVVTRFEEMSHKGLEDAMEALRAIGGSEWHKEKDPIATLLAGRSDLTTTPRRARKS